MYHLPTGIGHQVNVVFPKNITILEIVGAILVHNKSFLSAFHQLTDSTSKNRPIHNRQVLVQPKKYLVNIRRTLKQPF